MLHCTLYSLAPLLPLKDHFISLRAPRRLTSNRLTNSSAITVHGGLPGKSMYLPMSFFAVLLPPLLVVTCTEASPLVSEMPLSQAINYIAQIARITETVHSSRLWQSCLSMHICKWIFSWHTWILVAFSTVACKSATSEVSTALSLSSLRGNRNVR